MIPEEVAQIAYIIRNWFDPDYDESISAAWEIYNKLQMNKRIVDERDFESRPMFHS